MGRRQAQCSHDFRVPRDPVTRDQSGVDQLLKLDFLRDKPVDLKGRFEDRYREVLL